MPARTLMSLLLLSSILFGYLAYEYDEGYTYVLIILVVLLVMVYVFSPQLNWWWWMRHPPDLRRSLHLPLERTPFYQRLSDTGRRIFRQRVYLFNEGQVFRPQALKEVTEDIKTAISTAAMQVNFHRRNFLYPDYENVIVYAHPFPSPQYPDHLHASEIFEDEHGNGLIFSVEHVLRPFLEPYTYFNAALYEYARLLVRTSPANSFPVLPEDIWPVLERISGFPYERLLVYMGLDELDPLGVAIAHYHVFREQFVAVAPELAAQFDHLFSLQSA